MNKSAQLEPRINSVFRWIGILAFLMVCLFIAGTVLYLIFRALDREALITVAVLSVLGMFIAWPLGGLLATRATERFYILLQQGRPLTTSDPAVGTDVRNIYSVQDPPDHRGDLIPLNMDERQAAILLAKLEG